METKVLKWDDPYLAQRLFAQNVMYDAVTWLLERADRNSTYAIRVCSAPGCFVDEIVVVIPNAHLPHPIGSVMIES